MIIVKLMGGLGNQMFQYATGYALSKDKNTDLSIDKSWFDNQNGVARKATYELDLLNVSANSIDYSDLTVLKRKPYIKKLADLEVVGYDERSLAYDKYIYRLGSNIYLNGYWQTEKYFNHHREEILREFMVTAVISPKAKEWESKIVNSNSISLHIRRGDYATNVHTNAVHGLMPLDYYYNSIDYLKNKIESPKAYVFSDDPNWCKENLKLPIDCEFVQDTSGIEDMYLMSKCKHNIIANSSFSWWGAWLNQNDSKIVIAPKKWFNDTSIISKDIVPESWQRI